MARKEFLRIADHWPEDVRQSEIKLTNEEETADLVYNFLIPEVCPLSSHNAILIK